VIFIDSFVISVSSVIGRMKNSSHLFTAIILLICSFVNVMTVMMIRWWWCDDISVKLMFTHSYSSRTIMSVHCQLLFSVQRFCFSTHNGLITKLCLTLPTKNSVGSSCNEFHTWWELDLFQGTVRPQFSESTFVSCDLSGVISGQWQWPHHGCHISVWTICQGAGSPGAQCSVATFLPQGDICSVAWLQVWSYCNKSHLSADCTRHQVWRIQMWPGRFTMHIIK